MLSQKTNLTVFGENIKMSTLSVIFSQDVVTTHLICIITLEQNILYAVCTIFMNLSANFTVHCHLRNKSLVNVHKKAYPNICTSTVLSQRSKKSPITTNTIL